MNDFQPKPVEAIKGIFHGDKTPAKARPVDTVQIFLEARLKLAELADHALKETLNRAPTPSTDYSPSDLKKSEADNKTGRANDCRYSMLEQVRQRIKNCFYNRPEVKEEIAKKLVIEISKPVDDRE